MDKDNTHFCIRCQVFYNPNNIEEFYIEGDKTANIIGIVFIVLGSMFAIVGIFVKNN